MPMLLSKARKLFKEKYNPKMESKNCNKDIRINLIGMSVSKVLISQEARNRELLLPGQS